MVTEAEVPLVRLPSRLSQAVDDGVRCFVEDRGLRAHYRWRDADLWIVYQDSQATLKEGNKLVTVQTRVTVGAFAGEITFEPEIVFMPDILVIAADGRYILPPEKRKKAHAVLSLPHLTDPESLNGWVSEKLPQTWRTAVSLARRPEEANVLLEEWRA